MTKMIEVIGTSPNSFSEAVRKAVESIIESGENVYWFEVTEQRGVVRDSKLKEFQVKVKIAVESRTK